MGKFLLKIFNAIFVTSPLAKIIASFLSAILLLLVYDNFDSEIAGIIGAICFCYSLLIVLIAIVFAFIINPIRNFIKEHKDLNA